MLGEGNGTPPQYSCLENPMDGGAWWAAVYGVAQSQTRLKRHSSSRAFHRLGYHTFLQIQEKGVETLREEGPPGGLAALAVFSRSLGIAAGVGCPQTLHRRCPAVILILSGGPQSRWGGGSVRRSLENKLLAARGISSDLPPAPDKEIRTAETLGSVTRWG